MKIKPQSQPKFSYTVPQFKGLISSAFEPYLKGYADAEEVKLKDAIDKFQPATRTEIHGT